MTGTPDINTLCGLDGVNVPDQIKSLNDKLKKIGVPYYLVGKILPKKRTDGRPRYKTSWRKVNESLSAELNRTYPNTAYSNSKRVKDVLKKDYGIKMSDVFRPSTTDAAIERAAAFKADKSDTKISVSSRKEIQAAKNAAKKAEIKARIDAKKVALIAKKAETKLKIALKKAPKSKPAEVKKIEAKIEKVQEVAKEEVKKIEAKAEKIVEKAEKVEKSVESPKLKVESEKSKTSEINKEQEESDKLAKEIMAGNSAILDILKSKKG